MTINTNRFTAPPAALLHRLAAPAQPEAGFPRARPSIANARIVCVAGTLLALALGAGGGVLLVLGIRRLLAIAA